MEDRITNLPDALRSTILGLLDMKTVVRTSVLSTRWRSMWKSVSTLKLDASAFETEDVQPFVGFVNTVLLLRDPVDIEQFILYWDHNCDNVAAHVTTWILTVLRWNVQILHIQIRPNDLTFSLPHQLFLSPSLTDLTLDFGNAILDSQIFLPSSICLPRLKSLVLSNFYSEDGVIWINKLLLSCPVLTSLIIRDTWVRDTAVNVDCRELKHLEIINTNAREADSAGDFMVSIIKLCTPSLTSFICEDYMLEEFSIENLSSLATADIHMVKGEELYDNYEDKLRKRMLVFLTGLHNVKHLTISPADFLQVVSEVPNLMEHPSPQFHNLRYLNLEMNFTRSCLQALTWLLRGCPYVEALYLTSTEYNEEEEDGEVGSFVSCTLSHLKVIEIIGFEGSDNEIEFLELVMAHAVVLGKIDLHFGYDELSPCITESDRVKLIQKLEALPGASSSLSIKVIF